MRKSRVLPVCWSCNGADGRRAGGVEATAKAKGVKFGHQPTLTPHQQKEACKRLEAVAKRQSKFKKSASPESPLKNGRF